MSQPRSLTIGVDLGGTKILTALVDSSGNALTFKRQPTNPGKGPKRIIADIIGCVRDCLGDAALKAQALGVGVAGQIDEDNGVVRFAPNLEWHDVALRAELEQALSVPVVVTNDVRAATWGEWRHGAGRGIDDLICLFIGTGIGGGVVIEGRMLRGCSNTAGELGHMTVVVDGRKCRCPNRGCLEAYAGGWAIAERARESVQTDAAAGRALLALAGGLQAITGSHVARAYAGGDLLATRLVEETAHYLANGLVGIVNAFNPCLIVLGGGVIEGIPILLERAVEAVHTRALQSAVENLRVVRSALSGKAGAIGAAALARCKALGDSP